MTAISASLVSPGSSSFGAMLADRFRENPYDLAGFADLPEDDRSLKFALHDVLNWLWSDGPPSDGLLAKLLFVLLRVARDDYRDGVFWPHVTAHLGLGPPSGPDQAWLGDWFRRGLARFGYIVPDASRGQTNLTPILVHAGVPRGSLDGLVEFIAIQMQLRGDWLANAGELDADLISQFVGEHEGLPLHRNVRRALESNSRGVVELWTSLARLILAPAGSDEAEEALRLLPPGIDADAACRAVARVAAPSRAQALASAAVQHPRLRYDSATGDVWLLLPGGSADDWSVEAGESRLVWGRGPLGLGAVFADPLPELLTVRPRNPALGTGRTFQTRPKKWPGGFWFRASTGHLERGDLVDRSGIDAGRWFVLFQGTPEDPGDARPMPLNWAFSPGGKDWTAWEVEVPARTEGRREFVWKVGFNTFSVPLARRPGPSTRFSDPVLHAAREGNDRVPVYGSRPVVTLDRDQPIETRLRRWANDRWELGDALVLEPHQSTALPVKGAGLHQLLMAGGRGRVLVEFALIPGLDVQGPRFEGDEAVVEIRADARAGAVEKAASRGAAAVVARGTGRWRASVSTVQPQLEAVWRWADSATPSLRFRWPVSGLRWRISGEVGEPSEWTRDRIIVEESRVLEEGLRLEIQVPGSSDLTIDDAAVGDLKPSASGFRTIRSLSALGASVVRLTHGDVRHEAVVVTRRPILDRFEVFCDDQAVIAMWGPDLSPGTDLLIWDPLSPTTAPTVIPLSPEQLKDPGEWSGGWDVPPGADHLAVALAQQPDGFAWGFSHLLAVNREAPGRAVAQLIERPGRLIDPGARLWAKLAFDIQVDLVSPKLRADVNIASRLQEIRDAGAFPLGPILAFAEDLAEAPLIEPADRKGWIARYAAEIQRIARKLATFEDWAQAALSLGMAWLLRNGGHPGWMSPKRLADAGVDFDHLGMPLSHYRDLGLLASGPPDADRHCAAERVFDFHQDHDLPSPELFLPWRSGKIRAWHQATGHVYELSLAPPAEGGKAQFLKELGLDELVIEGETPQGGRFQLAWDPEARGGWTLAELLHHPDANGRPVGPFASRVQARAPRRGGEPSQEAPRAAEPSQHARRRPRRRRAGQGRRLGARRLLAPRVDANKLAERIDLKDLLTRWGAEVEVADGLAQLSRLEPIDEFLKNEPATGGLHKLVLEPPGQVEKLLRGTRVLAGVGWPIAEVVRTAWRIAWVDRLAARSGGRNAFGPVGTIPVDADRHLNALALMFERHEVLMFRSLALAELLIMTLRDGGIGFAAKRET